uniref:START domain-containing protein n=1 Tax=Attheya septentrionalis TaxID=420275 RepID=A0A7S2U5W0_9STRA|mmetsp:Transcript_11752/g.21396  ORF Transcript_11752/g.21396 Transcript_11752/m.21396 type:complete len:440 (+) Transcript_11752:125-1444(+)|eukprot:CAMPEP_0198304724 /NCGR_PEP_ID=MMETSP1449-20131203/57547_1 /TAXON_ID=420275 /ORGANISM="Attheya septentrionalis, Strain CCMP2084" /LENGTH=439 /DNA_ID=CAMNT_0044007253 /DNA_START=62 /DNA_END=1381 /DNA_ORIENTATION=+
MPVSASIHRKLMRRRKSKSKGDKYDQSNTSTSETTDRSALNISPYEEETFATAHSSAVDSEVVDDLKEMEKLFQQDQILEAREVACRILERIENDDSFSRLMSTDERFFLVQEVMERSDGVVDLLKKIHSDDGWTFSGKRKGITVHSRHVKGSSLLSVRTKTVFGNFTSDDFVKLCAIFSEADLTPEWFPHGLLKSADILAYPSKYLKVCHVKVSFGRLSPIAPRDMVVEGTGYHLPKENALFIVTRSVTSSPYCEIPPPPKGYVRMSSNGAFYVRLLPGNRVEFRQISADDMKLRYVPSPLLNFISKGGAPFENIACLKKTLKNFEGSVWEQRIKERTEFYNEIKERVLDEIRDFDHLDDITVTAKYQSQNRGTISKENPNAIGNRRNIGGQGNDSPNLPHIVLAITSAIFFPIDNGWLVLSILALILLYAVATRPKG